MTYLIKFVVVVTLSIGLFFVQWGATSSTHAKKRPCNVACKAANKVAKKKAYTGRKSKKRAGACVRILTDRNTEILMFAGDFSNGRKITGHPIKTQRPTAGRYENRHGVKIVEFCFSRRLATKPFTICNGRTKREGARHIINGRNLRRLQQTGHVGDYLTLLGKSSYKKYGRLFTSSDYRRRYGR